MDAPIVKNPADAPIADEPTAAWIRESDSALPMLPALASKVIEAASDPDVPVYQVAAIISKDPVLASRVLGLANSAQSGALQQITTINEAIIRVGTMAVRNLVITVCFSSRMCDRRIYGEDAERLIDHGIGTAYVARLVAERARIPAEEAFLCGLLHDIGKLVILRHAHNYRRQHGPQIPPDELQAALTLHHAMLGGRALKRWQLPAALDEPVACHHDYASAVRYRREAAVVYLANRLSHRYGFGCEPEAFDLLADPVCAELEVDAAWLEAADARAPGLFAVARQVFR